MFKFAQYLEQIHFVVSVLTDHLGIVMTDSDGKKSKNIWSVDDASQLFES